MMNSTRTIQSNTDFHVVVIGGKCAGTSLFPFLTGAAFGFFTEATALGSLNLSFPLSAENFFTLCDKLV